MLLSRSIRRKILATLLTSVGFLLLYQATVIDTRARPGGSYGASYLARPRVEFIATAYCKGQTTASGVAVTTGVAAADPRMLPVGSVVQVEGVPEQHQGIYTVLDTGPKVQGRHVDLYMWSCNEALAFGRRPVALTVLRRGWNPNGPDSGSVAPDARADRVDGLR
jgi:3D (Asp-Asp-Asp) domain-containing protein